jgi:hypothetical protein
MSLLGNGAFLGGSYTGSKKECIQMLQLAVGKGVKLWIMLLPMSDAKKAVGAVEAVKKNDLEGMYVDAGFEGSGELKQRTCMAGIYQYICMYSSINIELYLTHTRAR